MGYWLGLRAYVLGFWAYGLLVMAYNNGLGLGVFEWFRVYALLFRA